MTRNLIQFSKLCLLVIASCIALLWPALYNGYPLVYSDSGVYIFTGFLNEVPVDRPIGYSLFVRHMSLKYSLWIVLFIQALIVTYVLYMTVRRFNFKHSLASTAVIITILSFTTGISNYTSQIMPDIFSAVVILGTAVILTSKMIKIKEWILFVFIVFGAISHLSNVIVLIGVALIVIMAWIFKVVDRKTMFKALIIGVVPVLTLVSINKIYIGSFKMSRASNVFLIGRLIEVGVIKDYLNENCAKTDYVLCDEIEQIPNHAWVFLWDAESPLYKNGCNDFGMAYCWEEKNDKFGVLINDVLSESKYRNKVIKTCTIDFFRQLIDFKIGGLVPQRETSAVQLRIEDHFKNEVSEYKNARQYKSTLEFETMSLIQLVMVVTSLFIIVSGFIFWKRINLTKDHSRLIFFLLIGVLGNALTVVMFSAVLDRYQSRVIWILPLIGFILICKYLVEKSNLKMNS
jgi:hypothetical protein